MSKSEEILEMYKQYMMPTYVPSIVLEKGKGPRVFGKPELLSPNAATKDLLGCN